MARAPLGHTVQQGSLHYTPEHCLVNGGFLYFGVEKAVVQLGQMYLLRSPVQKPLFSVAKGNN